MSYSLDLAGVIGTWVGAFIGLVALVGIVGSLFAWRALRTERHAALAAVGNDNHGFISRGFPLGSYGRLFQLVRAPILDSEPEFKLESFQWNLDKLADTSSSSGWVQLGGLLRAYGISPPLGDSLRIRNSKTYLEVHRTWILALGLLGRYASRRDRGQLNRQPGRLRLSTSIHGQREDAFASVSSDDIASSVEILYGITGQMRFSTSFEHNADEYSLVHFKIQPKSLLNTFPIDSDVRELFLLSIGCIPMKFGAYFALKDLSTVGDELLLNSRSTSSESSRESSRSRRRSRYKRRQISGRDRRVTASLVVPETLRTFRLGTNPVLESNLERLAKPFKIESVNIHYLQTSHETRAETELLREQRDRTFMPAALPWIRLRDFQTDDKSQSEVEELGFIARSDAQLIALSLLTMSSHPEGFLMATDKSDSGLKLLTSCSSELIVLMTYVQTSHSYLGLSTANDQELSLALEYLHRQFEKSTVPRRSIFYKMFGLDQLLTTALEEERYISEMIGVIIITNPEFLGLVRQSARQFTGSEDLSIKLDTEAGVIKVPTAFGIIQEFVIDRERLFPEKTSPGEVVSVKYSVVLLSALKACLRSMMLTYCYQSDRLLGRILNSPEIILVA